MSSCPLKSRDLAQREVAAEMIVAVGVAARDSAADTRGDLDRQRRRVAAEDPSPGREDPFQSIRTNYSRITAELSLKSR